MPAEAPRSPGGRDCDCGAVGRFRIDDRRWCHECHAEMRAALERLAEVVRRAVVDRRLSPRAVQALADRIATGPDRQAEVQDPPPPAPPAVPQVPPRRGVDFPCEECGKLDGSNLDNGWWRCASCGFPGQ